VSCLSRHLDLIAKRSACIATIQNSISFDQVKAVEMSGAIPDEFDIIVCGGGSCGCVVAGR